MSNTLATVSVPDHLQNTVATAPRMRLLHTYNGRSLRTVVVCTTEANLPALFVNFWRRVCCSP